jgi:D-sedoheptulose 7-phosphate isomerase
MDNAFKESLALLRILEQDADFQKKIIEAADMMIEALISGHKILWCGNGGSAADCQHLSAELVARLQYARPALASVSLTTDTSYLTAWINDMGRGDHIFSRQIEALGQCGDVLVAISTSCNSANIIEALSKAEEKKIKRIVFGGNEGGKIRGMGNIELIVPSADTQRIQEIHMIIGHMICERIEKSFITP